MAAGSRHPTPATLSSLEHGGAIHATAFVCAPFAVIAPLSLAILLPLAAVVAAYAGWRAGARPRISAATSLLVAAFTLWGGLSALWAEQPRLVWSALAQFAVIGLGGIVLISLADSLGAEARRRIESALLAGVALAWLLLAAQWASDQLLERSLAARFFVREAYQPYMFNRAAAVLALLAWPSALAASRRFGPWSGGAVVLAIFVLLTQFDSMAALLGLGGGAIVALGALRLPRATALALAVVLVAATLVAPAIARLPAADTVADRAELSISITHRIKIWRFVAAAIAERPLLGWGLNASRELPGGQALIAPGANVLPLHPHNAFLQIWLELGIVGAALLALLLLHAVRAAYRRIGTGGLGRGWPAMALATLVAGGLVAATGYGIWQAWWLAGLWLAAIFAAALARDSGGEAPAR